MYVCVCVCVCEREREIERDRDRDRDRKRDRKREREREREGVWKEEGVENAGSKANCGAERARANYGVRAHDVSPMERMVYEQS